jgi:ectoine hydroxylase-related dioxygenase (phytanoyl-CoA dioxygenase family)
MRSISGAEIEHFRTYGFVRLKAMIAEEEIARLRGALDLAVRTFDRSPAGCDLTAIARQAKSLRARSGQQVAGPLGGDLGKALRDAGRDVLKETYEESRGRALLDFNTGLRVPALRQFALRPELPRIAAILLDVPGVRFYDDILVCKEAGALERCAVHQDGSFLHIDSMRGCTFWVFIDPVRDGRGAVGYVPSSHKWGDVFKPNFLLSDLPCQDGEGADMPPIDPAPTEFGVQYMDLDPGDIVVHHMMTLTGCQGNRGITPARGFGFLYIDAASRFKRRAGINLPPAYAALTDGAALSDRLHPLAWAQT